jgi:hypothetical protein
MLSVPRTILERLHAVVAAENARPCSTRACPYYDFSWHGDELCPRHAETAKLIEALQAILARKDEQP